GSIVTEVVGQGGGFLPPVLDESSPTVNMAWHADGWTKGDGNGDGLSDIVLTGVDWGNVPVAENQANGVFYGDAPALDTPAFTSWAAQVGSQAVGGDFNGDGRSEVALVGGPGWQSIPVALKTTSGSYQVVNGWSSDLVNFGAWAANQGVTAVAGDFDGDGRTDIAIIGGATTWASVPVAFSNGDGTFRVANQPLATFPGYASQPGAKPVTGDFDGDGRDDIALVGGTGSNLIPVALSNGDGSFTVKLETVTVGDTNFALYAAQPGVQVVSGDFDGDGKGDIALTGGSGWWTIPVAYSSNGAFRVTNNGINVGDGGFPTYASWSGVKAVAGDFNNDGKSDIALTGGSGWYTLPVAFSNGDGTFAVTNTSTQGLNFPGMASMTGVWANSGGY
ncbi:MAG TPA: VCBS repeat-containing protein, partial [Polyangia bacterium]|nr:VCBS repeat-containing protein [Polyangia bacterium]